jgi:hypothetical protein
MRDEAARIAAIKIIKDHLTKLDRESRDELADMMEPGDAIGARLDGLKLGKVSMREGSLSASIADPGAFLAWVKDDRPDEIQVTESVRELHVKNCLERAKEGEIIPGIDLRESAPTLALTGVAKNAYGDVLAAVRSGVLEIGA